MSIQSVGVGPLKALYTFFPPWQSCSFRHQLGFSDSAGSKTRGARSNLVGMGPPINLYYSMTFSHHLSVVSWVGLTFWIISNQRSLSAAHSGRILFCFMTIYKLWRTIKGMWTDNTRKAKIKRGSNLEVFLKILNLVMKILILIFFRN